MSQTPPPELSKEEIAMLEESQLTKLIGPIIKKLYDSKARDVVLLSWGSEALTREAARLLSICLSQQLNKKSCLVIFEGVRGHREDLGSHSRVSLPEVELGDAELAAKASAIESDSKRDFPFRVIVGPEIEGFEKVSSRRQKMALEADAHVLVMPAGGLPRRSGPALAEFSTRHKPRWLGLLLVETPKPQAGSFDYE